MPWKVFAEDAGTGLTSQDDADYGDGAQFNALVHDQNAKDYAPVAPSLNTDFSTPNTTLSESIYRVTVQDVSERDHDNDGTTVTWPEVTFVVYAPQTTLSLTDSDTNYIFLDFNLTTTGDDAQYVVNTTGSAPSAPSMQVAEIDTSTNTEKVVNDDPTGYFSDLYINSGVTSSKVHTNSVRTADGSNLVLQPNDGELVKVTRLDTAVDSYSDIVEFGSGTVDSNFIQSVRFQDYINFVNSSSIQDGGTIAINFDGSANVSVPNDLDVGSLTDGAGVTHTGELADIADLHTRPSAGTGLNESSNTFNVDEPIKTVSIDDTDSPYNTNGEDIIYVDNSSASVTVELSTTDLNNRTRPIEVIGAGSSFYDVKVTSEGSEPFQPDNESEKLLYGQRATESFWPSSDRTEWLSSLTVIAEELRSSEASSGTKPITLWDDILPAGDSSYDIGGPGVILDNLWTDSIRGDGSAVEMTDGVVDYNDLRNTL